MAKRLPLAHHGETLQEGPWGFLKPPSTSCVDHLDQLDPINVARLQGKAGMVAR